MNTTEITAWLGLLFSLIALYWQWNDKRPRLNISPRVVLRPMPSLSNNKDAIVLSIYLSNPGEKPVHVNEVRLVPNKGQEFQIFEYNAMYKNLSKPFTIDPLRGYDFLVDGQQLAHTLKAKGYLGEISVTIKVYDELNRQYKIKHTLSITELLSSDRI